MPTLFIIESPGKLKKIREILGDGYIIRASMGHVQDLDPKSFSINISRDFEQSYTISEGKSDIVSGLRDVYLECEDVILAQDGDSEGEQIAWSIAQLLGIPEPRRCIYNAITKTDVLRAMDNLQPISVPKVKAQNARRSIDRLMGYIISPIIQRHFNNSHLAAGRVMTPITRMIVEREMQIRSHMSSGDNFYCTVTACFKDERGNPFETRLYEPVLSSTTIENEDDSEETDETPATTNAYRMARWTEIQVRDFMNRYLETEYYILDLQERQTTKGPSAPYTTSTLQQFASRMMKTTPKRVMELAQKLYEKGAITYMRTDSTTLSNDCINMVKNYILRQYGERYSQPRKWETRSANAQQAHEAIRVNHIEKLTIPDATAEENRLYQIIWRQTLKSQMRNADFMTQSVEIGIPYQSWKFQSSTEKCLFNGYLILEEQQPVSEYGYHLTGLHPIQLVECNANQTSKKPPSRFDEATLVRELDKNGIGRPSTYSKMIDKIQDPKCQYAQIGNVDGVSKETRQWSWRIGDDKWKEKKKKSKIGTEKGVLVPTPLGLEITEYLVKTFPTLFEYKFTAHMETELDRIMEGTATYVEIMNEFYRVLKANVETTKGASILRMLESGGSSSSGTATRAVEKIDCDGWKLSYYKGQYGPCIMGVQGERRQFVSLPKDCESISNEDMIVLWRQKWIGVYQGEMIELCQGPYGYYLKWKGKNYKCGEGCNSLAMAIAVIDSSGKGSTGWRHEDDKFKYWYGEGKFGPYIAVNEKRTNTTRFVSWKPEYGELNTVNVLKIVG